MEKNEWLDNASAVINKDNITLGELMKEVKNNVKQLYPHAAMIVACAEPFQGNSVIYTVSELGENDAVVDALVNAMKIDERAMKHYQSAYMNYVVELDPDKLTGPANAIRNAIIDYADSLGKDTNGVKKSQQSAKEKPKSVGTLIELEQRITDTEAELKRLKQLRQPANIIKYLEAERKRLMRAGRLEEAKAKTQEIEAVQRAEQAKKTRLDNLAKAREKAAEMREKRKKQAEQAKHPQPQFNVIASQRLKQIKRDKAERAKSKKKGQEGKVYSNIHSTSPIFI